MANRFGRNQRRKLRDQIAARDREIARLNAVCSEHYRDKVKHIEARNRTEGEMVEWASRIVGLLGPDSAFARELADVGVDLRHFEDLINGHPLRVDAPHLNSLRPSSEPIRLAAMRIIETFALGASVESDEVWPRRRFQVFSPDGRCALMMNERTIADLKRRGDHELTRYLLQKLIAPWAKPKEGKN